MTKNPPILTTRLNAVADLIPSVECFADIGTDHAYLPIYLYMSNKCKRAIASDIGKGPLGRAEKTVKQFCLENEVDLRLGGGLDTLSQYEAEAIAIAGMGGIIISKILEDGKDKISEDCTLVLQPMTNVPELREYLSSGWVIERETLAKEDNKIYNILCVKKAPEYKCTMTDAELYLGKYLIENGNEHCEEYIAKKTDKLNKMIDGLLVSKTDESKQKLIKCRSLLNEINGIKKMEE